MYSLGKNSANEKEISWIQFKTYVQSGDIAKVVVENKETVEVFIKADSLKEKQYTKIANNKGGPQYRFTIGSVDNFENKLDEIEKNLPTSYQVTVQYVTSKNWFSSLLIWVLPIFLLYLLFARTMRGTGNNIFGFGQSNPTLFDQLNKSTVTFADVAGLDAAKEEVKEIVDFLKNPQDYTKLGAKIPKGVLLSGPPGTGKTLLGRAVAGEAGVPFLSLSGAEFVEMFVGVGASRVRDLFRKAKEKAPCIIFIDEIDAIGRSRGKIQSLNSVNDERESTLNQLLTEMDGFGTNSGVIVLGATNRGDILDHALLRPGRFDRHIYLELPDMNERKEILKVHLKPIQIDASVDIDILAAETPGFSGADIANLCNEAALIAARRKKDKVFKEDFFEALDRIIGGLEKRQKIVSTKEKEIVAYHEAGHALTTCFLKGTKDIVKVSIIPRGKSLGAAWYRPEELQLYSRKHLFDDITIMLGGRAAEETVFGEVTSGALDDLERATKQAYSMIAFYGLGDKIKNISFYDSTGSTENAFQKPYSEETARVIDEEVQTLITKAYENAKNILFSHKEELKEMGQLLLQKEVIYKEDIEKIITD